MHLKRILTAVAILWSAGAASETMICKKYGFTADPEQFHNIELGDTEHKFEITPTQVIADLSFRPDVFLKVDPGSVGLSDISDMDILTFKMKDELTVLYIYKEDGKTNIGISEIVEDSDVIFADKSLFSDCSFMEDKGGSQHAVASKSSRTLEARGVSYTIPVHRF